MAKQSAKKTGCKQIKFTRRNGTKVSFKACNVRSKAARRG